MVQPTYVELEPDVHESLVGLFVVVGLFGREGIILQIGLDVVKVACWISFRALVPGVCHPVHELFETLEIHGVHVFPISDREVFIIFSGRNCLAVELFRQFWISLDLHFLIFMEQFWNAAKNLIMKTGKRAWPEFRAW